MANLFNYPQVVMSLYDVPMEASGALSLGTSAGVGVEQGLGCLTCAWERADFHCNENSAGDQIVWGDWLIVGHDRYSGITSHDADVPRSDYTDQAGCANTGNVDAGYSCMQIRCGSCMFFTLSPYEGTSYICGLCSHCIDTNGSITNIDSIHNYDSQSRYLMAFWVDQSTVAPTNMIWVATARRDQEGWICTYCYNSSGVLELYSCCEISYGGGSSNEWMPEQLYSFTTSSPTAKYLVVTENCRGKSSSQGDNWLVRRKARYLSLWSIDISGGSSDGEMNLCKRDRISTLGGPTCINGIWGGCATHCYQDGGGYFITVEEDAFGRIDSWCLDDGPADELVHVDSYDYNDAENDNIRDSDGNWQPWAGMNCLSAITGDDTHFYVMSCSARYGIHGFTLSTSGVITRTLWSNNYDDNFFYGNPGHIFTCQGLDYIYVTGSGRVWPHCKVGGEHRSISGLYGGADDTDVSLSHYYKGGSYVTNTSGNANVPTSGTIDFSDFRNQEN